MSEDEQADEEPSRGSPIPPRPRWLWLVLFAIVGSLWATQLQGIVSSNDGSHVALARALALRGQTNIDGEEMLTLMVDMARRDGHAYSDRPPGTAFAALPAVSLSPGLDERWLQYSLGLMKADPPPESIEDTLVVLPASNRYIETYGVRRQKVEGRSPNLLALQGTALVVGLHCLVLGIAGLVLTRLVLLREEVDIDARLFALGALGLATLWGPYSTALFSHVTAGVALAGLVWALGRAEAAESPRSTHGWAALAGLAGGWAVSADYALLVAVVPLTLLVAPRRLWPSVLVGSAPIVAATLAYHDAAFGSPFSIGYDHQTNFEFARERGSTFSGNPLTGIKELWGRGVLLQSPIVLLGVYGLSRGPRRRWLYGLLPWMILLVFHRTPWGGATGDYRYLVPALPLLAIGLAHAWQRHVTDEPARGRWIGLAFIVAASASAAMTWSGFWAWRG